MKFRGLQVERVLSLRLYNSLLVTILRAFALSFGLIGLVVLTLSLFIQFSGIILALAVIAVALGLLIGSFHLYVSYIEEHPQYLIEPKKDGINPIDLCDLALVSVLLNWRRRPTWRTLLRELAASPQFMIILARLGVTSDIINAAIPDSDNLELVQQSLTDLAREQKPISIYSFFRVIYPDGPFPQLLNQLSVSDADFLLLLEYYQNLAENQIALRERQLTSNAVRTGGFAKEWAVSYTNLLDQFSFELTSDVSRRVTFMPIFSRQKVVGEMLTTLNKSAANHILMVGEPGVGKKEIFYHLAADILTYQTKTDLDGYQVRLLEVEKLLSAAGNNSELLSLVSHLFSDMLKAGNVILFIDHFETLINPSGEIGTANLATVLGDYLGDERLRIVATTYPDDYIKLIKTSPLLKDHFTRIDIEQPTGNDLVGVLLNNSPILERRDQVFFLYGALLEIAKLSSRYLRDSSSPARELAVAEGVVAVASSKGEKVIQSQDVRAVIEQKAKVPLQVDSTQRQTLLNLEAKLHTQIVGQNRAIKQISDALLRARAGLTEGDHPLGTFLFLGPTGVGKTETAKALASIYFGSPQRLVRLDMTEFADAGALEKLLGVDPVNQPGALTVALQENPSAVVLFDEVEKSSDQIKNVLLQVLDEGRLTTNYGKVLDLTNTIIIATSNGGSDFIKEQISHGATSAAFEHQLLDRLINDKVFLPEFLNRFDGVIVFSSLNGAEMKEVVELQLSILKQTVNKEKGVELEVAPAVINQLAEKGYDPVFGARALERVIKNDLETVIARELISQQPKPGSKLIVNSL